MSSIELAVSLVRSLFCGLPRQEKRMAVFVAASDETSGGNTLSPHHYAGWIAPESDWYQYFAPAWQERVLDGPPRIPYLHMTEIRSKAWRKKHGISEADADERLDEAAIAISQMGSLYPMFLTIDMKVFAPLYKEHKLITASGAVKQYLPDYYSFTAYCFAVLSYVNAKHPAAEKVDFLVENNSEVTKHIYEFYQGMPNALDHVKASHLKRLIGEFLPAGKERVPLQAADYLAWHCRRADAGTLTDIRDVRRFNTISHRSGFHFDVPDDVLEGLSEAIKKYGMTDEQLKRIRGFRQNNARPDEGSAQRDKSSTRRRKSRKGKAAQKTR